ncbi:Uncharacterised protein [Chryseobacterium nakagawai]|uniref:Uncharacterized protein n=1 Tax=Chryseobacterium nakagawai TaxID=1241982 RepID=A0AAD0YM43_CHRNA|nr:hypothetical protein [Chryseobacterium nakagawai]AZA90943.1 hypothetical protein EG343_09990 [Chryseobacterium nakagawai]VEH22481.1 Uncharacterised protein [Chryseobacterium nakagawai]
MRESGKTEEIETLKKYMKGEPRGIIKPFISSDKGKFVLSGLIQGSMEMKIGKLVQVRRKMGAFGTDVVLIREADGTLSSHHNQCFWIIPDQYHGKLNSMFKDVYNDDADLHEYSIDGKEKTKGFIV